MPFSPNHGPPTRHWPLLVVSLVCFLPLRSPAASAPTAYKQIRLGRAVVSLPAHWTSLGPEIPLWLHLHGARSLGVFLERVLPVGERPPDAVSPKTPHETRR